MKRITPEDASKNFPKSDNYSAGFTANQNFKVDFKTGDELLITENGMGSFKHQGHTFTGNNHTVLERYKKSKLFKK